MLTVEMKINGKSIGHVTARRVDVGGGDNGDDDGLGAGDTGEATYWTEMRYDRTDTKHNDIVGRHVLVTHNPEDGAWELVRKIIEDPSGVLHVRVADTDDSGPEQMSGAE